VLGGVLVTRVTSDVTRSTPGSVTRLGLFML
jgi:hypothetical protein